VLALGERERPDRLEPRPSGAASAPSARRSPACRSTSWPTRTARRETCRGCRRRGATPYQPGRARADSCRGSPVTADVLAQEAEIREAVHQRPRQLGCLPVFVDRGQHLAVDEAAGGDEVLPLLPGELIAHPEVVRSQARHRDARRAPPGSTPVLLSAGVPVLLARAGRAP
jgi:hypothetical protein